MSEVAEVLLAAAKVLARDGWCQGAIRDKQNHVDALGAIGRAAAALRSDQDVAAVRALTAVVGPVVPWNDAPERVGFEVIAALHCAAAECAS